LFLYRAIRGTLLRIKKVRASRSSQWASKMFMARVTPVIVGWCTSRTWKNNSKWYYKSLLLTNWCTTELL